MLQIGKTNEVKFKVNVNGTQSIPTVRVVLVTPNADLGFPAEKLSSGNEDWSAEVFIPEDLSEGEYDLRVEVIINNRLFTPVKRKVAIGVDPAVTLAKQEAENKLSLEKPAVQEAVMQAPIKNGGRTKPVKVAEPVKITMADISAESEKRFGKVLKESSTYKSPVVKTPSLNVQQQIPVTLTKGEIIYE
jgi:hypothetical protein